jgi:hypothetical protein
MNIKQLVVKLVTELSAYSPVIKECSTGSVYITFSGSKVKQVRVSNRSGHKNKPNHWELRTYAMTKRNGSTRIYNSKSINQLIKDFK